MLKNPKMSTTEADFEIMLFDGDIRNVYSITKIEESAHVPDPLFSVPAIVRRNIAKLSNTKFAANVNWLFSNGYIDCCPNDRLKMFYIRLARGQSTNDDIQPNLLMTWCPDRVPILSVDTARQVLAPSAEFSELVAALRESEHIDKLVSVQELDPSASIIDTALRACAQARRNAPGSSSMSPDEYMYQWAQTGMHVPTSPTRNMFKAPDTVMDVFVGIDKEVSSYVNAYMTVCDSMLAMFNDPAFAPIVMFWLRHPELQQFGRALVRSETEEEKKIAARNAEAVRAARDEEQYRRRQAAALLGDDDDSDDMSDTDVPVPEAAAAAAAVSLPMTTGYVPANARGIAEYVWRSAMDRIGHPYVFPFPDRADLVTPLAQRQTPRLTDELERHCKNNAMTETDVHDVFVLCEVFARIWYHDVVIRQHATWVTHKTIGRLASYFGVAEIATTMSAVAKVGLRDTKTINISELKRRALGLVKWQWQRETRDFIAHVQRAEHEPACPDPSALRDLDNRETKLRELGQEFTAFALLRAELLAKFPDPAMHVLAAYDWSPLRFDFFEEYRDIQEQLVNPTVELATIADQYEGNKTAKAIIDREKKRLNAEIANIRAELAKLDHMYKIIFAVRTDRPVAAASATRPTETKTDTATGAEREMWIRKVNVDFPAFTAWRRAAHPPTPKRTGPAAANTAASTTPAELMDEFFKHYLDVCKRTGSEKLLRQLEDFFFKFFDESAPVSGAKTWVFEHPVAGSIRRYSVEDIPVPSAVQQAAAKLSALDVGSMYVRFLASGARSELFFDVPLGPDETFMSRFESIVSAPMAASAALDRFLARTRVYAPSTLSIRTYPWDITAPRDAIAGHPSWALPGVYCNKYAPRTPLVQYLRALSVNDMAAARIAAAGSALETLSLIHGQTQYVDWCRRVSRLFGGRADAFVGVAVSDFFPGNEFIGRALAIAKTNPYQYQRCFEIADTTFKIAHLRVNMAEIMLRLSEVKLDGAEVPEVWRTNLTLCANQAQAGFAPWRKHVYQLVLRGSDSAESAYSTNDLAMVVDPQPTTPEDIVAEAAMCGIKVTRVPTQVPWVVRASYTQDEVLGVFVRAVRQYGLERVYDDGVVPILFDRLPHMDSPRPIRPSVLLTNKLAVLPADLAKFFGTHKNVYPWEIREAVDKTLHCQSTRTQLQVALASETARGPTTVSAAADPGFLVAYYEATGPLRTLKAKIADFFASNKAPELNDIRDAWQTASLRLNDMPQVLTYLDFMRGKLGAEWADRLNNAVMSE